MSAATKGRKKADICGTGNTTITDVGNFSQTFLVRDLGGKSQLEQCSTAKGERD